jgi:hypothetical protein
VALCAPRPTCFCDDFHDRRTDGIHGDHTDNEYEYIDSDTGDNHGDDTDCAPAAAFAALTAGSASVRCAALDGRRGRRRALNDLGGGALPGRRGCARGPDRSERGQRAARPEAASARACTSARTLGQKHICASGKHKSYRII